MTELTGKTIANTYKQLLRVGVSTNTGVSAGLSTIETGDGTDSSFQLATGSAKFTGSLVIDGATSIASGLHVDQKVCASAFYGDGSNLSGVTASLATSICVSNALINNTLTVNGEATFNANASVSGNLNIGGTVTVAGAVSLASTLSVGGAANFASTVTVVGAALLKNNTSIGGTLNVAGAGTFTSKTEFNDDVSVSGALDVAGNTSIGGTFMATGAATFDNNVSVSGGLVVGGTVTILGANVQAASARVCASAYHGDGSNITNISGPQISGDVSVSNIKAAGNVSIAGTLNVTGTVTIAGTNIKAVNAAVCASAFYGDGANLTNITASIVNNRVSGNFAVSANLSVGGTSNLTGAATFASTVTVVGTAALKSSLLVSDGLNVTGGASIGGNLQQTGAATFTSTVTVTGATHLQSTASVGGAATFASTVTVVGATHLQSTASIGGAATFASTVTVVGATHLQSTASVGGAATFASTVTVVGAAALKSNVTVGGTLDVSGNTSIGGTFMTTGAATFDSNVSVSGNVNIGGTTTIAGAVSLASTLSVGGVTNFASTVTIAGAVSLASTLSVGGAANFASTVTIAGANVQAVNAKVCASAYYGDGSNLTGIAAAQITGDISVNNATIGGTLYVGSTVTVAGTAIFEGAVSVSGTVNIAGNTSIGGTFLTTGKAEFEDDVSVSGALTVGGATQLNSTVTIAGATHLQSTVSVAGNTQLSGTLSIGVDDTGYDVKFFGATSGSYMLWDESTDDLILGGASKLGIGTASPAHALHVLGDTSAFTVNPSSTLCVIGTASAAATNSSLYIDTKGTGSIIFRYAAGGTESMRITGAGLVGIGCTPSHSLQVAAGADTDAMYLDVNGNFFITDGNIQITNPNGASQAALVVTQSHTSAAAATFGGSITANNFAGRNIIYNGGMKVAQRSTSETGLGAASGYFTTDRWVVSVSTAGRFTMAQIADGPPGFANCTKLSCTTADTSIAAGELIAFAQNLEGQDLQQIKKGTASAEQLTLSFWVKGNASATYVAELFDVDNSRQISKTFAVTTSWAKITLLIPADTTGAFDDDNANSLALNIWLHAGSSYTSGTLNSSAWAANNNTNRAVGISSFVDATSRTFFITGVQMELGPTATEFEHMTYGSELELCKRYYQVIGGDTVYQNIVNATYYSAGDAVGTFRHHPPLRGIPTVAKSGNWAVLGGVGVVSQTVSGDQNGPNSIQLGFTGGSSGVTGQSTIIRVSNDANFRLSFDAEL